MELTFEEMRAMYAKQLRNNADVIEKCECMDEVICALYSHSKLAIARFAHAKKYASDIDTILQFCRDIDNIKPSQ